MKRQLFILVSALLVVGCGADRKLAVIRNSEAPTLITIPEREDSFQEISVVSEHRDTLRVTGPDGRELLIMNAIRDENGEMVANDVLDAAVVSARFRNVAERHGKVDLRFEVRVPESMTDARWQIRLHPKMTVMGETVELDSLAITGSAYRKAQIRGYQQYDKFLRSIVTDSADFVRMRDLEIFLRRNIPQLYKYKEDTAYVSDMEFASAYGVTEREAVEHYTSQFRIRVNDSRVSRIGKMYDRYVKSPIVSEGLRLDTVINSGAGEIIYEYVQTVNVNSGMTRADIVMDGAIYEQDKCQFNIRETEPITFYISSLSSLVDETPRYLTRILERKAYANSVCWIDFEVGKAVVDTLLGNNAEETGRIKANIATLLSNDEYEIDSIIVTASCSPEGRYEYNSGLSRARSEAVAAFFGDLADLKFISRYIPENWENLAKAVENDEILGDEAKSSFRIAMQEKDPDVREGILSLLPEYEYISETLYPSLRTVRFDFCLHRRGMIKDTVYTTVLDTAYMRGVQAIRDRKYEEALTILRPYADFNTAIAYCSMDYNESARSILRELEPTAGVEYMMALLCSRDSDDALAVQHYLNACNLNGAYVHRGNLDPEISQLIHKYNLNNY